jgi:hypothetical protein
MRSQNTSIADWVQIVRGEFQEVPGLRLSKPQFQRLWGLDGKTCDALVNELVDEHFLKQTPNGTYARVDDGY